VVDLRPDDGIPATYTIFPGLSNSYAGVLLNGETGQLEWYRRSEWLASNLQ
jgi:hypothetical protein